MKIPYFPMISAVSAVVAFSPMLMPAAMGAQAGSAEDVQVLTRGPVHEAFAEPVTFEAQAGIIVKAVPPKPIEELPPAQQPVGDNVKWIPGYWAWDDDRNDFIWISGIWRNLPPGRQWIPGYWSDIGDGQYQWTSGYWADANVAETTYLPAPPPRNLDIGPNVAASSDDQTWIPGNWVWSATRYVWQPGCWMPLRPDWTWVPSRYCWTRRGYVYVDGYWDYAVDRRGVLFAPVCFSHRIYEMPDYYYTPSIVIGLSVFTDHLFVRPRCGMYYFGDYYGANYLDNGYYASCEWGGRYGGYDPVFAYERWTHRHDRGWVGRIRNDYNFFRTHEDLRPRHTWAAMQAFGKNRFNDGRNRTFATDLTAGGKQLAGGQRFRTLDKAGRDQFAAQGREMRWFGQNRSQMETRSPVKGGVSNNAIVGKGLGRSPIINHEKSRFAGREAPAARAGNGIAGVRPNIASKELRQAGASGAGDSRKLAGRTDPAIGRGSERGNVAAIPKSLPNKKPAYGSIGQPDKDRIAIRQAPKRDAGSNRILPQQSVRQRMPATEFGRKSPNLTSPQRQLQPRVREAPQLKMPSAPPRQVKPQIQMPSRVREAPQFKMPSAAPRQVKPQIQMPSRVREAPQLKMPSAAPRHVQPQAQFQQAAPRQFQAAPQGKGQGGGASAAQDARDRKKDHGGH